MTTSQKNSDTKQVIIDTLIKIRRKKIGKRAKENVEKSIRCVEEMELCLGDYSESYIRKVYIDGREVCLVYDKSKGLENNYIGKINLKTEDFSILYEILEKYDLITYR